MDEPGPAPLPPADQGAGATRSRSFALGAGALMLAAGAVVGIVIARARDEIPAPVAVPSGWTDHRLPDDGFGVALPPGWERVPTNSADEAFKALRDANPQLASLVREQLAGSLSQLIRFLAFDTRSPTLAEEFATNMNVVFISAPTVDDLDAFVELNLAELRRVPGIGPEIQTQRLELPAGETAVLTSRLTLNAPGGAQVSAITQYLFLRRDLGYVLSFTTLPGHVATYAPLFERIARTFRYV